ncbi:hypothetical protein PoB_005580500 [Plakobranchus ocellatus]|uniref:Uncharacterized protein n=1 Tax=Plakobranchus ocellatus TaxID=259542 RepID=A0AAV4CCB8_9GAST|nr:hypothetical protein PoB_005580500 [Plakobranchus ocellatus]
MREQPIGAPSGPTDFALGPTLRGRLPVRLSRKRPGTFIKKIFAEATGGAPGGDRACPGRDRLDGSSPSADPADRRGTRTETVQTGEA